MNMNPTTTYQLVKLQHSERMAHAERARMAALASLREEPVAPAHRGLHVTRRRVSVAAATLALALSITTGVVMGGTDGGAAGEPAAPSSARAGGGGGVVLIR